jgi:hypothetical protein
MTIAVTARDVLRSRQWSGRIDPIARGSVTDTVRHLLAMQAQDFGQALWAVGSRTAGSTRSDVLAALATGEIVRTLPMRGTLHFIASEDLGWMLDLTATRMLQSATTRFRALGLDEATLTRSERVAIDALSGGNALSRDDFMKLLEANGISPEGQRGYHVIFYLNQRQILCWGPPAGTQQALVLVDEWISNARTLGREESLREFAVRYFTGHGLATVRDFAWWSKLTLTDARAGIALAGDELVALSVGDETYLASAREWDAAQTAHTARAGTGVHVLAGFDEYLLAYQDRSLPLPEIHSQKIVPGNNGIFLPIIVAQGQIVGTWRRAARSKTGAIEPEYFVAPSVALEKGVARAAKRYAEFVAG